MLSTTRIDEVEERQLDDVTTTQQVRVTTTPRRCRQPAARRFVRDVQSAARLLVSPSRLRLDGLTGSRLALWAS